MAPETDEAAASITSWLLRWKDGEADALARLVALVYAELRRLAAIFLSDERDNHTLQPTALVHELYVRLESSRPIDWQCRGQFLAVAARMMRNILVDHARKRAAARRGGVSIVRTGLPLGPHSDVEPADRTSTIDVILIDTALSRFGAQYPRQAEVVELRFFGGLTAEETVEAMSVNGHQVSLRTVERDWRFSKAWLQNELGRL
jgi:RNA polymerase sigma factor (TIGR02999 family)